MQNFFSEVYKYTDIKNISLSFSKKGINTSLSFSTNASVTTVIKYSSKKFMTTTVSVPFNRSHFKGKGFDESFSKENIGSTLSNISSIFQVKEVSCSAIFNASEKEISKAKRITKRVGNSISDEKYINLTYNCTSFIAQRGYIMSSLTEEEENFPLAFSISTYTGAEMFERLLRAIYRPQNYYCIQVDRSASEKFFRAVSSIVDCFPNVFLASKRIDVIWGEFTVLETELICMKDLWQFPKWKYFFTLTGQEFPLKTNFELVKILTAYQGANDVMTTVKHANPERWYNTLPPHGLKPVKGSVHIIVNRDYVGFILQNRISYDLLNWTKKTFIPDETFFAILNANPQLGIKGTYKGEPEHSATRPFLARYKVWEWDPIPCAGKYVRDVCILTTGDLPLLGQAKEMIANKFFLDWDRVVIGCLEEKIFNNTRDEYLGIKTVNTSYYSNLDFVKNQVT
ncbi:unnamed protein product [Candidula unifasciata]|uniref:Uncharacterized protein n=1 Tax=Candidula unifasciata TaxID=100452 RepID=A0A8S3Z708_9EUPU|nr:unnamed protein product [Candidula unifasciata]